MKNNHFFKLLSVFIITLIINTTATSCESKEEPIVEQSKEQEQNKKLENEVQQVQFKLEEAQAEIEKINAEKIKAEKDKQDAKQAEAVAVDQKEKAEAEIEKIKADAELNKAKADAETENAEKKDSSDDNSHNKALAIANENLKKALEELETAKLHLKNANIELNVANKETKKANAELAIANKKLALANLELAQLKSELAIKKAELAKKQAELAKKEAELAEKEDLLVEKESELDDAKAEVEKDKTPADEEAKEDVVDNKPVNSGSPCGKFNYDPTNLACVSPVGNGNDGCINSDGLFVSLRDKVSNPCNTKLAILDIEINLGIDIDDDFVENHCGYQGPPPSINPKISVADAKIYFVALFGEKIGNEFGDLLNTNGDDWLDRNEATAAKGKDPRQTLNLPVKSGLGTDDVLAYLGLYLGDGALDKYAGDLGDEVMDNLKSFTRTWQPGTTAISPRYDTTRKKLDL